MSSEQQWYEDLVVGATYRSPQGIEVSADDIIAFARQYDPQIGHLDPVAARRTIFGSLAASGWHTAALTMKLMTECGFPLHQGAAAQVELVWPTPTRPGDVLSLELRIDSKRESASKPDRGIVVIRYDTTNQLGELRQSTTATLIVSRRPAG